MNTHHTMIELKPGHSYGRPHAIPTRDDLPWAQAQALKLKEEAIADGKEVWTAPQWLNDTLCGVLGVWGLLWRAAVYLTFLAGMAAVSVIGALVTLGKWAIAVRLLKLLLQ